MNFAINPWERSVCMCVRMSGSEHVCVCGRQCLSHEAKCKNEIQEQQQVESSRVEPLRVDSLSSI